MSEFASVSNRLEPFHIGEHPALDFANTLAEPHGVLHDFIAQPEAFLNWAQETQGMGQVYQLALQAKQRGELASALDEVKALRDWLCAILPRIHAGEIAAEADVAVVLNRVLALGTHQWCLTRQAGRAVFELQATYARPGCVAAALAVLIGDLLTQVKNSDVRKCENPACSLWFRDTTKRGNRRWCSMAACGNRAKAAAHRLRSKTER